ncbi:hypothetical protein ABT063_00985 [Streptomyces sp. NPDC002838]|uniref:hypothetical protein n=1 Tax=Streptomyces sp. NPDC002838 TaxID=3154436 RepID=UPI0033170AB0
MTDATMGPGPEGTPREDRSKGNATAPAAQDRDRTTGSSPATGSPATGSPATSDPAMAAPRGETATGRDGALNASGTSGLAGTPDRAGPSHPLGATAREGSGASRAPAREAPGSPLLPHDESDKLALRLQHTVAGFVDGPRDAVEEADRVLEEAASRFTDAVTQRRRTLRNSWQTTEGGVEGKPATSADTEQLRLALRDYRELAERLLRL